MKERKPFKTIRLFNKAFGAYKPQILVLTIIGFLSGILEGVGANALIPLFSFITGEGEGGIDFISSAIEKAFLYFNVDFGLKNLLVFISLLFIFKAVVLFIGTFIQVKIAYDYEKKLRLDLYNKTLQARWSYLLHQKIGYLEKTLSLEVNMATALLKNISSLILILTGLLMYLLVAFNISFYISATTILLGGILLFLFKPLLSKIRKVASEAAKINRLVAHFINENVLGIKTIKTTSAAENLVRISDRYFARLKKVKIKHALLGSIPAVFFQPISIIFIMVVFTFVYKTTNFNIAVFVAVVYLIQRIFTFIQQLQTSMNKMYNAMPYVENILRYGEQIDNHREDGGGDEIFEFNDNFSFKEVSFSYDQKKEVLSDITLGIKKGEFAGLIGPSGSGKTTIVDLILRLFDPSSGRIYLDKKEISKIDIGEWRKHVGYVSQDIYVMNDTIENNIKFYNLHITDEEMIHFAKLANIYEFIMNLPEGFKSIVGERGIMLSAGQRQRIIIARTLARKPHFLILDEATSALDNESEMHIQETIENLKGKMTVLVIAHRLSTVMNCDNLLVLEDGKIVEQGKPQELLRNKESYFFKMYNIRK